MRSEVSFEDVKGVSPQALAALHAHGFRFATPVQAATIPLFCGHKDVSVDASTGSGKTLAFVLPVAEKLRGLEEPLKKHEIGAIIVSPTRELARQIHTVAQPFLATVPGTTSMLLVGGTDPLVDSTRLKEHGAHVLVGTPGRLADLLRRCTFLDPRRLEVLVLDEADRLLDMGFQAQLDEIMGRLPKQRRTGLFSATQTEAVESLARAGLRNPVRVTVAVTGQSAGSAVPAEGQKTPSTLDISYVVCESTEKLGQLITFLQDHRDQKTIVYFLTCACVDLFASLLGRLQQTKQLLIKALHGRMKQAAREATLAAFTNLPAGCLFCTDVAARGLDIPDVNWVLQFDPPQDPAAFVHRVGRAARMGRTGHALVYLLPSELTYVDFLRLRKVPLEERQAAAAVLGLLPMLRAETEADRDLMDKATKAFVSYVRGYKEHQCRFIFRLGDLDLGLMGMAFALLRMPRMAEIKHAAVALKNFVPSEVDPDTVKYKDKQREKQRQKSLAAKSAADPAAQKQKSADKRYGKGAAAVPAKKLPASKRRLLDMRQDADDMSNEYNLLKKLKRGKLTEGEYDVLTGLIEESNAPEGPVDTVPKQGAVLTQPQAPRRKHSQPKQQKKFLKQRHKSQR